MSATEIRDFHLEKGHALKDEVVLILHNIDESWRDQDIKKFMSGILGTR